jgi:Rieske Fe-S protein
MVSSAPEPDTSIAARPPVHARRRFLGIFLGGGLLASLASFFYPVVRYLIPPAAADLGADSVTAAQVGELRPNTARIFRFGNRPGLLLLGADNTYRALSATCTHLDCTVQYRAEQHDIWCACHNGVYDLTGRNVSGPPPRPLQLYDVHVRGNEVIVSKRKEA